MERALKQVDLLRHELKALRYLLDRVHDGGLSPDVLPAREDFLAPPSRELYDAIVTAPNRAAAEAAVRALDLEAVEVSSFLSLSGDHYYSYPALVRERAAAWRAGRLRVEPQ